MTNTWLKNLILVFMISFISMEVSAQNIQTSTLSWTVNSLTDLNANTTKDNYSCLFKTSAGSISWIQKNGALTTPVTVQNIDGTWDDVSSTGTATFQVTIDGFSGTLDFERSSEGIFIMLRLTTDDPGGVYHRYRVSSISAE